MTQTLPEDQQQFHEVAADFDTAMLVTRGDDGSMHARPMAVADLRPNGETYFATALDSPKVQELERDATALITFQGNDQFATLRGKIRVSRDPALIERLWRESWEVWFPGGKADPNLCILVVNGIDGEFWDRQGTEGIGYRFVDAQTTPDDVAEENHAKVKFQQMR
jgi:general stress protein 26